MKHIIFTLFIIVVSLPSFGDDFLDKHKVEIQESIKKQIRHLEQFYQCIDDVRSLEEIQKCKMEFNKLKVDKEKQKVLEKEFSKSPNPEPFFGR